MMQALLITSLLIAQVETAKERFGDLFVQSKSGTQIRELVELHQIIVEVDESLTLDPEAVEAAITPYTRAIMPVHMRGAPCRIIARIFRRARHDPDCLRRAVPARLGRDRPLCRHAGEEHR